MLHLKIVVVVGILIDLCIRPVRNNITGGDDIQMIVAHPRVRFVCHVVCYMLAVQF